jgi:hypothetical protein
MEKRMTTSISDDTSSRRARGPRAVLDLDEVQQTATIALTVLRRALVEGTPVTREAITHEAAIVFATDPADAASRLDCQAEGLGVSSLI